MIPVGTASDSDIMGNLDRSVDVLLIQGYCLNLSLVGISSSSTGLTLIANPPACGPGAAHFAVSCRWRAAGSASLEQYIDFVRILLSQNDQYRPQT